ncbi:MAG: EAL domain-containing protein [Pseudomonadota bacterium]
MLTRLDTLTIALASAVLVLGVLVLVYWRRQRALRARLARLSGEVRDAASDSFVGRRLDTDADDSLAPINQTINQLFDALGEKERELADRDVWFARFAGALPEVTLIHNERILFANETAAALLGVEARQLIDKPVTDLVKPPYRALVRETTARRLAGEQVPERQELQLISAENGAQWVEASGVLTTYRGQPAVLTVARDIGYRKAGGDPEAGNGVLPMALEGIAECIVTTDKQGVVLWMNNAAEQTLGVLRNDAVGMPFGQIATLVDEIDFKALGNPVERCLAQRQRINMGRRALLLRSSGGESCSVELTASPIERRDGELEGCIVVFHDVSEIRGHARQITYQASHDALTGLINRREFEGRVSAAVKSARGKGTRHIVAYLDLDRFKTVNDSCGHQAGDELLRKVASILRDQVRDSDSVARIGGDEFAMLLPGCPIDKASAIADETCKAIADYRFVWRDRIFTIGVSIGLLEVTDQAGSVQDVLAAADSACYMAKRAGRGKVHIYSETDEIIARERGEIRWLQRLQTALREGRFGLAVQPIISLSRGSNGQPNGPACEVLLRLHGRHGEVVNPSEFLDAAERYQLMPDIDRWVVRTTFAAVANHELKLPAGRSCAINLSGQTLSDDGFLEFVVDALDTAGLAAELFCFEVTEEAVYEQFANARRFIEVLHGMGSRFALDNYGSAPGAFTRLRDLPLDYLKIDGKLTRNLAQDSVNQELVASMIRLADTMKFRTVAEQVEGQEDFDTLRDLGVDFAQGFFIRQPDLLGDSA